MTTLKRILSVVVTGWLLTVPIAGMQPPATGAALDGFVPIDQLPPQEQLPAAPLLITAYVFVWVLLMVYLWTIARRLGKVESEMQALTRRTPGGPMR